MKIFSPKKKLKPFLNCSTLPIKKFYQVLETNDLRHLLDCEELPEYNQELLIPVWDAIVKEYQELTDSKAYSMNLLKMGNDLIKHNRLNGLIACYHLLRYGENCEEQLNYWGVSNNIKLVEQKIRQEQTRLNISIIQENSKVKPESKDFEEILIDVENALNRNLDVEKITVKKWVFICKKIAERAKQIEQLNNKHVRQNTGTRAS